MNDFHLLYLFSFPIEDFYQYRDNDYNNEFVYLEKYEGKVYFFYKNCYFEVNNEKIVKPVKDPQIPFFSLNGGINYNEDEIDFSSILNLKENRIIYLYKIYYLGDNLEIKKDQL